MIKFAKALKWILFNAVFLGFIIGALFFDSEGAKNVTLFIVTITLISSIASVYSEETIKRRADKGFSVSKWLDITFDVIVTGLFVWHGWWYCALAAFSTLIFQIAYREEVEKVQEAGNPA